MHFTSRPLQRTSLLIACIAAGSSGLSAAVTFRDSGQRLEGQISTDVALGDVDGDGDIDAFIVQNNSQQTHRLWLNNGSGVFAASPTPPVGAYADAVALADLDGDADLDAVFGEYISSAVRHVWINQGGTQAGTAGVFFQSPQTAANWSRVFAFAVGQLDARLGPDLFPVGPFGASTVWYSTGDAQFLPGEEILDDNQGSDVSLGDVDGDGDLDAFVVYRNAPPGEGRRVYLNQSGIQAGTAGVFQASGQIWGNAPTGTGVALGDLDEDGDLDAYVVGNPGRGEIWVNGGGAQGLTPGVFLNNGQNLGPTDGSNDVALGDLDRDGDLDAVVAYTGGCTIYENINLNEATFRPGPSITNTGIVLGLALGDLDGDGDLDVVLAKSGAPDEVWFNDAAPPPPPTAPIIQDSGQSLGAGSFLGVALADFDGDGDLDAVTVGNEEDPAIAADDGNVLWVNQGRAQSGTEGQLADSGLRFGTAAAYDVAAGDVDGDGDADVIIVGAEKATLWFNRGGAQGGTIGAFVASEVEIYQQLKRVALRDFDGDGDLDLFGTIFDQQMVVYPNPGGAQGGTAGQFAATGVEIARVPTGLAANGFAVVDADGDMDPDVIVNEERTGGGGFALWRNPGSINGPWVRYDVVTVAEQASDFVAADLDGDGDVDLATERLAVFWNQGDGSFVPGPGGGDSILVPGQDLLAGDLDRDGRIDLLVTSFVDEDHTVWRGDVHLGRPGGSFETAHSFFSGVIRNGALGDLDGDGDLDVWFVGERENRVWVSNEAELPVRLFGTTPRLVDASGERYIRVLIESPFPFNDLLVPSRGSASGFSVRITATAPQQLGVSTSTLESGNISYSVQNPTAENGEPKTAHVAITVQTPGVLLAGPDRFGLSFIPVAPVPRSSFGSPRACVAVLLTWIFSAENDAADVGVPVRSRLARTMDATTGLDLDVLYRLRDEVLSASPGGRYFADLYATTSVEVIELLASDPALAWQAYHLLIDWTPAIREVVEGRGATVDITPDMVGALTRFLDAVAAKASDELCAKLAAERLALAPQTWADLSPLAVLDRMATQVRALPEISGHPQTQSITAGGSVELAASGGGDGPFAFQWYRNDVAIPGATAPTLTLPSTQTFQAGEYRVVVTNPFGSATSNIAQLTIDPAPASDARLLNLSTRALAQSGDGVLIPGFVISGTGTKRLLVRAVGPTLTGLGVVNALADPHLVLKRYDAVSATYVDLAANDTWGAQTNAAGIASTAAAVGAFTLPADSADAALLTDLGAGQYTVVASGVNNTSGIALVELYDADIGSPPATARLVNLSNRGFAGAGDQVMIPGFVVSPEGARTVLVRAVGPTLAQAPFSVPGTMADPLLRVYRSETGGASTLLFTNDDWGAGPAPAATAQVAQQVSAFALGSGSKDAALVLTLAPGVYTLHGASADGTGTGVILVEVYVVP